MDYEILFRIQHREKKNKVFLKYKEEVNIHRRLLIRIQVRDYRRIKQETKFVRNTVQHFSDWLKN